MFVKISFSLPMADVDEPVVTMVVDSQMADVHDAVVAMVICFTCATLMRRSSSWLYTWPTLMRRSCYDCKDS